jgi:hypothetical protein
VKKINQRTFSEVASLIGKTAALFDTKSAEAFLLSISDTELKPDALAVRTSKPVGCWPLFFLQVHSSFRTNTQNGTE